MNVFSSQLTILHLVGNAVKCKIDFWAGVLLWLKFLFIFCSCIFNVFLALVANFIGANLSLYRVAHGVEKFSAIECAASVRNLCLGFSRIKHCLTIAQFIHILAHNMRLIADGSVFFLAVGAELA